MTERIYTVQPGDTLAAIAQEYYGNSSEDAWRRIYDDNKDVIGPDPTRLEPGMVLNIPPTPLSFMEKYTVQPGDTLAAIAQRFYGDGSEYAWGFIYASSKDVIGPDPTRLEPGMVLTIQIPMPTVWNS